MRARTTLRKALADPKLLGNAIPGESWSAWRTLLIAAMGEPLEPAELEVFRRLTGRETSPTERVSELWCIFGRKGGKSKAIGVLLCYLATLCKAKLSRGETGVVLCISTSRDQASIALNYAYAALEGSPILSGLIRRRTAETIELTNGIVIDVRSASFRRLRGMTCLAVVADEVAFWLSDESANPDTEILGALRPTLLTTRGPLICISSPHARRGELWNTYQRHYGPQGDPLILVARGASQDLNPTIPQRDLDREYEKDPAWASAEYGAEFRTDIESFISIEAIRACVDPDVRERPYNRIHSYTAFVDPSGGSNDSFTLAISHKEGQTSVLDVIRETRPPFSPEGIVANYAALLRDYHVFSVFGDRYAGEWPREQFRKHGVTYEPFERSKSELYRDVLPLINSRTAALLEHQTLQRQLVGLERAWRQGFH